MPFATRLPVDLLVTWLVRPAKLALGLAVLALVVPGPVEAEYASFTCWIMVALSSSDLLQKSSQADRQFLKKVLPSAPVEA